eukprot:CAMPEP_0170635298 /NCGR_PEP_ID=MMETSP0224-20130122/37135_1 /TAXON_ID=285029 /ORGANISM="Togula jolla, Strain CCCM 725" /LENGTH=30 /DNA_ID= /DNA_START= /DNA_END= /DNA_ORIENTATION=
MPLISLSPQEASVPAHFGSSAVGRQPGRSG